MDRAEAEAIYDAGRDVCVEFIVELAGRVEQHEERLARLEAELRQDSRTSSRPPSLDPPKTRAQRRAEARAKAKELMRREGEQRPPGGQSGHRGAGRELRPEDQVDEIVDHYPDACGGCGREFSDQERRPRRRFGRHQTCELPPMSVIWTEHRTHQLRCRSCRARTSAQLPEQLAGSVFGPRLQAAIVTLTAGYRVSRRGIRELARDLFGVTLSTGSVDAICQRASDALAGPHLQLGDWVLDQDAVHVDETGWRTRGEGRALWTATAPDAVFLQIAEHCNREQFNALIGTAYPGIVISDRWNGYSHLDPSRRQACWSHIKRDFRRHADGLGEQKIFGEHGVALTRRVFTAWRAFQHEHHDRDRLQAEIAPIQTELRALLEEASPKSNRTRWHRQFANNLLKIWPALWTFLTVNGVQPTNNPAERALRAPVIHRKVSLGSQSTNGERFAERALSAAGTCRLQRRSLFTYLSELIPAHTRGDPFPALAA
ncbi:MAG TPA: IS66 family transposase [Steroidobacteraceae bacterium]|nr:IS66 family transposase [Steroidobacteraceae bacterium]